MSVESKLLREMHQIRAVYVGRGIDEGGCSFTVSIQDYQGLVPLKRGRYSENGTVPRWWWPNCLTLIAQFDSSLEIWYRGKYNNKKIPQRYSSDFRLPCRSAQIERWVRKFQMWLWLELKLRTCFYLMNEMQNMLSINCPASGEAPNWGKYFVPSWLALVSEDEFDIFAPFQDIICIYCYLGKGSAVIFSCTIVLNATDDWVYILIIPWDWQQFR